jgi:two-component system, chemotaxis family, chemotaxis protein CheY
MVLGAGVRAIRERVEHRTVLIVDDNTDLRTSLADVLELEGWHTVQATDGADALRALEREDAPDVIVLDLLMPVMDGRQFLSALRANPSRAGMPIVVMTGTVPRDDLGVAAVLEKPFELAPFLDLLGQGTAARAA